MSIVMVGSTSGSITLQEPAVAGNTVLTLPANTGTIITTASTFAGTGPAFSAYISANQSISAGTFTKAQFDTEEFDTASCFSTSTYRFTPNVAGYYQVNLMIYTSATSSGQGIGAIYKNGSITKASSQSIATSQINPVPALIYLNGSTDYIEAYGYFNTGTGGVIAGASSNAPYCYFQAFLARAA